MVWLLEVYFENELGNVLVTHESWLQDARRPEIKTSIMR